MRLNSYGIPAAILGGITLLAMPLCLFSQEHGSSLIVTAATELPEAPHPQIAVASTGSLTQQTQAIESQSVQQSGTATSQTGNAEPQLGSISGTAMDVNDDIIPGATVVLEGSDHGDRRTAVADDNGAFLFSDLKPGIPYHLTISANGFISWTSADIILNPGQHLFLTENKLKIAGGTTSVTVISTREQIAVEQVSVEEQQRVFGFIPNFYVVYDSKPAPLSAKLKFKLALRAATDPVTFLGVAFYAGIDQAANTPDYVQGMKGYGQRLGADYTSGFTDIFIGGAILPSLLHQDPRYFYQGTGTKKSRTLHALESPFVCKGDNGRLEPNFSSVGGDLAAASISNAYYPATNRGPNLVFENALITTGARMVNSLVQEFVLRKFTPKARK